MNKNYQMKFKVTKRQYEFIKFKAEKSGYRYTAHFLRDLALSHDQMKMIKEMHEILKNDKERRTSWMDFSAERGIG